MNTKDKFHCPTCGRFVPKWMVFCPKHEPKLAEPELTEQEMFAKCKDFADELNMSADHREALWNDAGKDVRVLLAYLHGLLFPPSDNRPMQLAQG